MRKMGVLNVVELGVRKHKKIIIIILIVLIAIFLRIFKISTNAHFQADEARDLVNIHQIFVEKKITLVGPISDDGNHLFSSLTYYLILPFAVIFNFNPMGTVSGAVFWGLVTFVCFWLLAIKVNPKMLILSGILAALWWPLIQISRWPWNPNFVPLWIVLSIYLSLYKGKKFKILSGLSAGLALHHHVLAVISSVFVWLKKRSFLWILGFIFAMLPFVIFDLRHPPGLFFSKMIFYGRDQTLGIKLSEIIPKIIGIVKFTNNYLFPGTFLTLIISIIICAIFIWDIKNKSKNVYWGISIFLSLGVFLFFTQQPQYLLGTLPLFWMWLFGPRKKWGQKMVVILIIIICLSSLIKYKSEIYKDDFKGNIRLFSGASKIIKDQINNQQLINANLAVLGSEDEDRFGKTYRGILLTWDMKLKGITEYVTSDNLFIITQKEVNNLQGDGAAEIDGFRNGPVIGVWPVVGTNWKVVQFNR
jgi:hypothetical protein